MKEQIALEAVAMAKRPFTVTVYAVPGVRSKNRNDEVHSVFGSSPEVPFTYLMTPWPPPSGADEVATGAKLGEFELSCAAIAAEAPRTVRSRHRS